MLGLGHISSTLILPSIGSQFIMNLPQSYSMMDIILSPKQCFSIFYMKLIADCYMI